MASKLMLDEHNKYLIHVIAAWAVIAKDALHTCCYGCSPSQLVFGMNLNIPSNLTKKPPALEGITHGQLVLKHLNVIHEDGNVFIVAESCEKLFRALKSKTRVASGLMIQQVEMVVRS